MTTAWDAAEVASGFGILGVVTREETGVLCHECGRWFKMLVQHLRQAHQLTVADYRQRHQLPQQVPLTGLATSARIRDATLNGFERDPARRAKWEAARDPDNARTLAHANEPTLGTTRARHHTAPRPPRTRICTVCSAAFDITGNTKEWRVCSAECYAEAKRLAPRRRECARTGEDWDFVRTPGTGAKLTPDLIEQATGLKWEAWRTRVRRGQAPAHDGPWRRAWRLRDQAWLA